MIQMKRVLLLLLFSVTLQANILSELRQDLSNISLEASKTRQNIDYKPYIMSVFTQKELLKLGVRNLEDTLSLVPSVDIAADNLMTKTPVFRGSNSFAFGQSKLYIDGVYVNQVLFDTYSQWLSMPIHMIKRIEVIRGPSISTDTLASYAGSVNVITFAEDKKLNSSFMYADIGSNKLRSGGYGKHFDLENLHIYNDFYYLKHERSVDVANDGTFYGFAQNGIAPLSLETFSTSIDVNYNDLEFIGRYLGQKEGVAFGPMFLLANSSDKINLPQYNLELRYNKRINEDLSLAFKVGIQNESYSIYGIFAPAGFQGEFTIYNDGIYSDFEVEQRRLYHQGQLAYSGIEHHTLKFLYNIQNESAIKQNTIVTNRFTGIGLVDYSDTLPFFDNNANRDSILVLAEDEYSFSDDLSLVFALEYEEHNNKHRVINPRFSAVYRYDWENILKATYTSSYRAPSWQEVYIRNNVVRHGNNNLEVEDVEAYEFSYIYKPSLDKTFKSSIFYLRNGNQIQKDSTFKYQNLKDTDVYGLELEFETSITDRDKLWFTYSLLDSDEATKDLAYSSRHLVKSYYIYNFTPYISASSTFKYNSSKSRFPNELREDIEDTFVVDSALQWRNESYSVIFGVKNIFDTKEVFASEPLSGYKKDYSRVGRSFNLSVRKEF